jgi:hypothetical protein
MYWSELAAEMVKMRMLWGARVHAGSDHGRPASDGGSHASPCVDDSGEHLDPCRLDGDDERRSRSATSRTLFRRLGEQGPVRRRRGLSGGVPERSRSEQHARIRIDDHADEEDTDLRGVRAYERKGKPRAPSVKEAGQQGRTM